MKAFFAFLFIILSLTQQAAAQALHIDSTRFITGTMPYTQINFAIPTADKGVLFAGSASYNAGGIIPSIPYGNANVLIGKIDSNQQISWIKEYGGSQDDVASCAIQTPDGGYAVLAYTESNDGDVTGFKGEIDIWLIKVDASGNLLWEKCYGSTMQDEAISIANTPDNGFIILGWTNGSDGDVPFHYGSTLLFDWVVIKTDSAGTVQWSKDIGGTADEGFGSILAADSGYYIACTSGSIDYDCTDTAWHPAIAGTGTGNNYYLLRLDDTGKVLWDSSYGGSHADWISYAMLDGRDSSIVIIGSTESLDYMVTGYHDCTLTTYRNGDIWIIKVNKNGKLLWEKALGSVQDETGAGICAAPNGGYLAYGQTFPEVCNDSTIGDIGAQDCWLFLLDSSGDIISNKIFGGIEGESAYSIVPYLNGYVATGTSGSSVFTEGSCNINYSGAFVSYIGFLPLAVNNVYSPNELAIKVYPNPTQGEVKITTSPTLQGDLAISNILGQIVYACKISSQNKITEINTDGWANGLYVVHWHSVDGRMLSTKLIKN